MFPSERLVLVPAWECVIRHWKFSHHLLRKGALRRDYDIAITLHWMWTGAATGKTAIPNTVAHHPPSPYAAPSLKVGFTRLAPTNHHHVERDSRKKTGFNVAEYVSSGRGGVIIETITSFLCVLTI